jgi:hydrogenase expression/formation protein HypE
VQNNQSILLAHGDGGLLTHELIEGLFSRYFYNEILGTFSDAAIFPGASENLALTTDSFVVDPIFFAGGDIGKLAVCGTINDLAVSGAIPLYLTAAFIIEEGLLMADLEKVVVSMAHTCKEASVKIIAGDTKVVPRNQADKIFINTTGIGYLPSGIDLGYHRIEEKDKLIVNGSLGDHGLAILTQRERLGLNNQIKSDCAFLHQLISKLLNKSTGIKFMRDLTRGGLATVLKEVAQAARVDFWLVEENIPVNETVRTIADFLGLDPLYLACEGKFLVVVAPEEAEKVVRLLKENELGSQANIVGEVAAKNTRGNVYLKTTFGGTRKINMLTGAPLPRIC